MTRSTAWDDHPDHRIEIEAEPVTVRIRAGERVLAESTRALRLREDRYPPVVYVPRADVAMERLAPSRHHTHCPFKGDASYFDLLDEPHAGAGVAIEQVAWSYEEPFDQMDAIRGHLAFYADRVSIESAGD